MNIQYLRGSATLREVFLLAFALLLGYGWFQSNFGEDTPPPEPSKNNTFAQATFDVNKTLNSDSPGMHYTHDGGAHEVHSTPTAFALRFFGEALVYWSHDGNWGLTIIGHSFVSNTAKDPPSQSTEGSLSDPEFDEITLNYQDEEARQAFDVEYVDHTPHYKLFLPERQHTPLIWDIRIIPLGNSAHVYWVVRDDTLGSGLCQETYVVWGSDQTCHDLSTQKGTLHWFGSTTFMLWLEETFFSSFAWPIGSQHLFQALAPEQRMMWSLPHCIPPPIWD